MSPLPTHSLGVELAFLLANCPVAGGEVAGGWPDRAGLWDQETEDFTPLPPRQPYQLRWKGAMGEGGGLETEPSLIAP